MLATLALALALTAASPDPPPIGEREFEALHSRLFSKTAETWEKIPWSTDLLRARRRSAREGKPLFLWSMNGHPLGCV